jgi:hypothetical protein
LSLCIVQWWDLVLVNSRRGIYLLVVNGCGWYWPLQLQKLLLEVGDHLRPLLKLDVLHLHVVLKVDDLVGTSIHLPTSDVEQHTGVVPPVLGLTKPTVSDLQLAVLHWGWAHTAIEDNILMPQPLELTRSSGGVLLVCHQTHTLLHDGLDGVVLEVE